MTGSLPKRVIVASRCAWTTFNFRRQLIGELRRAGVEVITCGAGGDGYEGRLAEEGIQFVPLPLGRGAGDLLQDFRYLLACFRLLRRLRPELVHAFTIKPVIFCLLAAALARVPVRVAMITGLGYAFTSSGSLLRGFISLLYRLALRRVHLVYFQNTADRDELLSRGIVTADKVRMIAGSGVDTSMFSPAVRASIGDEAVFVMVARVLREKGVEEFLAAARAVRQKSRSVRFILVGGTDNRNPTSLTDDEVRSAAAKAGVEWTGQVDDVRPLIANADVVVLPSYREGTPMSLLEAAAMAKPMIATSVPGCTEVVIEGSTGWLVPPRDSAALAQAVSKALTERDRWRRYGDNARALALSHFDSRHICRQIMDDYRELMSRSKD